MRLLLYSLMFVSASYAVTPAQDAQHKNATNQISGQVVDAEGNPVRGASVCANSVNPPGIGHCAPSRKGGQFTIHMLKAGLEYIVFAAKYEDYYPFPTSGFYDAHPESRVKVKLEERYPPKDIVVRMGPKAARLMGTVLNAETNEVLKQFRILACREDRPDNCIAAGAADKSARFNFLVPAATFTIKISASGFEDWYGSEGPRDRATAMSVAPETTMELNVFLRPLPARTSRQHQP